MSPTTLDEYVQMMEAGDATLAQLDPCSLEVRELMEAHYEEHTAYWEYEAEYQRHMARVEADMQIDLWSEKEVAS